MPINTLLLQAQVTRQAGRFRLTQLVSEVPELLHHLTPSTLKALLATNQGLRNHIQSSITGVSLSAAPDAVEQLVSQQWVTHLQKLTFCAPVTLRSLSIFHSVTWTSLHTLSFEDAQLNKECLMHIAAAELLNVQHLNFSGNDLSDRRTAHLLANNWPELKTLFLQNCQLNAASIAHFAKASWQQLDTLDLQNNDFLAVNLAQLSEGKWLRLRRLRLPCVDFHCHKVGVAGSLANTLQQWSNANWPQLAQLKFAYTKKPWWTASLDWLRHCNWHQLQDVDLSLVRLAAEDMETISKCHWPLLHKLNLVGRAPGIYYLAQANWPMLRQLTLLMLEPQSSSMCLSDLAKAHWPKLEHLCLHGNQIDAACMAELVKADWRLLRVLDISCCEFDAAALRQLMRAQWCALECLEVASDTCQQELAALFGVAVQAKLEIGLNHVVRPEQVANGCWPELHTLIITSPRGDSHSFPGENIIIERSKPSRMSTCRMRLVCGDRTPLRHLARYNFAS